MASISGMQTNAIVKVASTFGTAVSGGAGNKFKGEITPNFNVDTLTPRQIGSGVHMIQTATRGNYKPSLSLAMDGGYRNTMDYILAQFFGTSGTPSEQTASQADYKHTLTFNTTINAKYLTMAYESSSATVIEYPSCATRSVSFNVSDAPGILEFGAELIAHNAVLSSTTNTNASMASATATDVEVIAFNFDDTFRINTSSGGSLSGSDQYNITGYNLTLTRPQDFTGEIKAAAGNGAPIPTGLFEGTLQVTVKELADHTYFTYWQNETPLKCRLDIQGTQIGSGVNKAVTIYIPKMILVQEPQYALTSDGVNALTLNFQIVAATSNPTGMSSTYPYVEIINGLSTSLLA